MRNHWMGGGLLAAGTLLVLGAGYIAGGGSGSVVQAQAAECVAESNCVLIVKETDPDDSDQDFAFESDADQGDFELNGGDSERLSIDDDGTITIVEAETDGWTLTDISCETDEGVEDDIDEGAGSVTIDFGALGEGEFASASCTFTNEMDATPTATATTTSTATATPTTSATTTVAATATPTSTPVAPTPTVSTGGTISPPSTGSAGLKR